MTGAPFGRGRTAARILARVIDGSAWAGARVPAGVAHALATAGGTIEWAVRPGKRDRLARNLAHAVGAAPTSRHVRRLVREEIRNEAHRSADLLWALGRPDEFLATVELDGIELAQQAAEAGRGVILAGTHLGGWEVATAVPAATLAVPINVIVADDWLAWAIEHARAAAGLQVLYPNEAALTGVRLLRRGEALLVLGDDGRHASRKALVRFLDSSARLPTGVASLSRLSGAPVVSFAVLPVARRRWRVVVSPALDAPAPEDGTAGDELLLQQLADQWSAQIRAHPQHWAASYRIDWTEEVG